MGLRDYLRILLRHRLYAIATGLLIFSAVALWTFTQPSIYEAQGRLLFKQKNSALSNPATSGGARGEFGQLGSVAFGNPLDTQAEIIQSRPMALTVISALSLKDPRYPERPLKPEIFLKTLKVEALRRTDLLTIKYRDLDARTAASVVNTVARNYIDRNIQENRTEASAVRTFVESQLPVLEQRLKIAERKLRDFKEQYGSVALPAEQSTVVQQLSKYKSEQASTAIQLAEITTRANSLASRIGMSESDAITASALSRTDGVKELRKSLLDTESKLAVLRTQYQENYPEVDLLVKRRDALRGLLQSEAGRLLQRKQAPGSLVDTAVKADLASPAAKDDLPRLDEVRQDLLKAFIDARVDEISVRTRAEALDRVAERYSAQVADMPRLEETQRQLERTLEANQEAFKLMQRKFQDSRIQEAENIGNATLVEPAVPPEIPIWPRTLLLLGAGGLVAVILGAAVAFIREFLDESIQTADEARTVLGAPVLGTIPRMNEASTKLSLIALRDPLSPISESYRSVRTNVKFLSAEQAIQVVVFSSAGPQEGKSTTSANFAIVNAQSGLRVLLIDVDLRKPRQHQIWETPNRAGLTNVLVGEGDWRELVQPTEQDRLTLLTSGPLPPNPVALLESRQMADLLLKLRSEFDLIVIDSPPLTAATDAMVLSALSDGLILIVRPSVANKRVLAKLRDSLKRVKLLGQVVNGVIAENEGYSAYYYYNRYSTDTTNPNTGRVPVNNGSRSWLKLFSNGQNGKRRS